MFILFIVILNRWWNILNHLFCFTPSPGKDIVIESKNYQACPWEWDSHGKHPMGWDGMGWDGTTNICISHGRVAIL